MNRTDFSRTGRFPITPHFPGRGGQGLTEYIALLLLIAVACFAATRGLGGIVKSKITEARNHINSDISIQN